MDKHWQNLKQIVKSGNLQKEVSLAPFTTMKIGGPARFLLHSNDIEEVRQVLDYCRSRKLPTFILGGGSNVVFSDSGFRGMVIKLRLNHYRTVSSGQQTLVEFEAGYPATLAAIKMAELGLSGFEGLFGLPGTIGGAIYQNSKWPKENYQISDQIVEVTYLDQNQNLVTKPKSELQFAYGYSSFQSFACVIVKAVFSFEKKEQKLIQELHQRVMTYRQRTQPQGVKTAGCVFKNPGAQSAGYLLDQCGMKQQKSGDLVVSDLHANFFINQGKATAKDYLTLVTLAKKKVKERFFLDLKEEVQFVK